MTAAMRRPIALAALVLALVASPAAAQQDPSNPFGPLPEPAPQATPTPTPPPSVEAQQETDRTLLFGIAGGLLILFLAIGWVITRNARTTLRETGRGDPPKQRDQGPHKHAKQAKSKARAKTKAQRRARRANR